MASFEQLSQVMGGLKGAPASVVLTLLLAGRPLSLGELNLLTGYSPRPVRLAVRALLARGILTREGPRVLALSAGWPQKAAENAGDVIQNALQDQIPGHTAKMTADPAHNTQQQSRTLSRAGRIKAQSAALPADCDAKMTGEEPAAGGNKMAGKPAENETQMTADPAHYDPRQNHTRSRAGRIEALSAGEAADSEVQMSTETGQTNQPGQYDRDSGRIDHVGSPFVPSKKQNAVVVDLDQQQQQQIPEAAVPLADLLRSIGIRGRVFWRLVAREDLVASPEVVLAWWWYYRTQDGVRNPAGAVISRLYAHDRPPEGYLALATLWPELSGELRQEMESLVLSNWSSEQIAARLQPLCPGLTAGAVLAFMALTLEELES